jgi:hypothetical protein
MLVRRILAAVAMGTSTNRLVAERGVLFAATGRRHREEVVAAAARVRRVMPEVHVAVVTDAPLEDSVFDDVRILARPDFGFRDKVTAVLVTPFRKTIFLDTDVYTCGSISDVFDVLDRFDVAGAHASNRVSSRSAYAIEGIPAAFPEINSGVLAFRRTRPVLDCLKRWRQLFDQDLTRYAQRARDGEENLKAPGDQSSLREALYRSTLRIATLPSEYNFRFEFPAFAAKEVKVLHGRHLDIESIGRLVNATTGRRVWLPHVGMMNIDQGSGGATAWPQLVREDAGLSSQGSSARHD